MRGAPILIVFFAMFVAASLLLPLPMFPGSLFCTMIGPAVETYMKYLSALFNGVFYGVILWLAFVAMSKRLESEK